MRRTSVLFFFFCTDRMDFANDPYDHESPSHQVISLNFEGKRLWHVTIFGYNNTINRRLRRRDQMFYASGSHVVALRWIWCVYLHLIFAWLVFLSPEEAGKSAPISYNFLFCHRSRHSTPPSSSKGSSGNWNSSLLVQNSPVTYDGTCSSRK